MPVKAACRSNGMNRRSAGRADCAGLKPGKYGSPRYGYQAQQDGVRLLAHRTQTGLVVLVPDPAPVEQRCYETEQPCSPYLFTNLEKRGLTLQEGFRRRAAPGQSLPHTVYTNEIQRHYPCLQ